MTKHIATMLSLITLGWMMLPQSLAAATEHVIPSQNGAGIYEINNASELWGFADIVNGTNGQSKNLTAKANLMADIDMGGLDGGSWPGLQTYKGVFDGQNHTITNYYQCSTSGYRTGFVGILQGTNSSNRAVLKNLTIIGEKELKVSVPMHGTMVGDVQGFATVQDVISRINLTCMATSSMVGGFTGCILTNGLVERCTYSGTINTGTVVSRIGGLVGEMRGGTLSNSLFDGAIVSNLDNSTIIVGGMVGATGNSDNSKIEHCFSKGTITLVNAENNNCGTVIGQVLKKLILQNVYFTRENNIGVTDAVGSASASITGTAIDMTALSDVWNGNLHFNLGETNWLQPTYAYDEYPRPGLGGVHNHRYNANGFCLAGDGYAEAPLNGEYYEISNGGQLFWFAEYVNAGHWTAKARLMSDINLENYEFPGIGTAANAYTGTFDGQGHLISGYRRVVATGTRQGFINYASGATIQDFQLEGEMTIGASESFYGGIVGFADNLAEMTIEDVHSAVDIIVTGTPTAVGGIAGRARATINRCRYSGSISGNNTAKQIGGIVASSQGGVTLTNCLFDGSISTNSTTTNKRDFRIAGMVAAHDNGGNITVSNCLVNGAIHLPATAPTEETDYVGIVCGTTDLNNGFSISVTNTYYTTTATTKGEEPFTLVHGLTRQDATFSCTQRTTQAWATIGSLLNASSSNWSIRSGQDYPVPTQPGAATLCHYVNGFSPDAEVAQCGQYQPAEVHNNIYWVKNGGNLFWLATMLNAGLLEHSISIRLDADIDLEGREFPGIGTDAYRFGGVFDGQNHQITGYQCTTTANSAGLFNITEGATISHFRLSGTMATSHQNAGSVIGLAYGITQIDEVTSTVAITCSTGAQSVGGLVGCIGSRMGGSPAIINHCRYAGTLSAGSSYQNIGGIAGVAQNVHISNTLFDGTITSSSTQSGLQVAGILAGTTGTPDVTIYSCLVHGTITLPGGAPTTNSGIVYGSLTGGTIAISAVYYTTTGTGSLGAGPAIGGAYIATNATTAELLRTRYVGTQLGFGDWYLRVGTDEYPLPGELHTCDHGTLDQYGLCSHCSRLSPIQQDADGTYLIASASDFGSFRDIVNSGRYKGNINAKMTADINASASPVAYVEPAGNLIHPYTGTFDGQGHSFIGITMNAPSQDGFGFFGYIADATIKNVHFGGTLTAGTGSSMIAPAVGCAMGTCLLEDITCSTDINITNASSSEVGGIVGRMDEHVTLNRCRYTGTITLGSATNAIGGIAGHVRGGNVLNCLFDGSISGEFAVSGLNIGGIVAKATDIVSGDERTISNLYACLSHGTITLAAGAYPNSGIVVGRTDGSIKTGHTYYTTVAKSGLTMGGSASIEGTPTAVSDATDESQISSSHLDLDNWKRDATLHYPIPTAGGGDAHQHVYQNGFCTTAGSCSARYQEASYGEAEGAYLIENGGQLMWFMKTYNDNKSSLQSTNVLLTADIDMDCEHYDCPTFATSSNKYTGIFDGNGHTISGFHRSVTGSQVGIALFGYTNQAEIKNLKLQGSMTFTGMTTTSYFLASVVANGTNTQLTDVSSSVDMTFVGGTTLTRIIGGVAGRLQGKMNKCRYNGTITLDNQNTQKVAGLCASVSGLTMSNCLFDGTILSSSGNTSASLVIIGGLVATDDNGQLKMDHCLSHGTITLSNAGVTITNVGAVWGSITRTNSSASTTYYTTAGITRNGVEVPQYGGSCASSSMTCTPVGSTLWTDIRNSLQAENWHIESSGTPAYPIPGKEVACLHEYNAAGWCTHCNARIPLTHDDQGVYEIAYLAQFASFRDLVNKNAGQELHARLTADMHFEWYDGNLGEPMGYNQANKFVGSFDGQDHVISGIHIECNHNYAGLFGYVEDATIHNFTIGGTLKVNGAAENCGTVVAYATGHTTLQDIHSSIDVSIYDAGCRVIGGIVGRLDGQNIVFNRCRYSGTLTANAAYDRVGGLIGEMGQTDIMNSLYDGAIIFSSPMENIIAGGLVAQLNSAGAIHNCLSHGTINQTGPKVGALLGYAANRPMTIDRVIYTLDGALTSAYGSARTGTISTTLGYPWDLTADSKLHNGEAHAVLGETNWRQTSFAQGYYPVPGTGGGAHEHTYNENGFCMANDGAYQPATQDIDGYYKVTNAGQLWWLAEQLNSGSLAKNIRIKLTQDIDMEGNHHGSFPGICPLSGEDWNTAFQGIFDGQGHCIGNYYFSQSGIRRGLFNTTLDATIRNFSINGEMHVTGNANTNGSLQGVAVGAARGNTVIEDIHSSVNIAGSGVRDLGGIVGCMENTGNQASVKLNRCRYDGVITLSGVGNSGVGGIVGALRSAVVSNVLFDGTIRTTAGAEFKYVGGIVGVVENNSNSELHRALSHGTISLGNYAAAQEQATQDGGQKVTGCLSGIVVGAMFRSLNVLKCYHTTSGANASLPAMGPQIDLTTTGEGDSKVQIETLISDYLLGSSTDMTGSSDLYSETFHTNLGKSNWELVSYTAGNYPKPKKDPEHIHYYVNGFCTSGDGEYEKPSAMGKIYQIDNGGKLYWFAEHFNAGDIPQDATVDIMNDIDMEGQNYVYPGIGTEQRKFRGTFNGYGHRLTNFQRDIVNSNYTGLINDADGAKISNFSLSGELRYNCSTVKTFHGSIVGRIVGTESVIEDITSFVNIKVNNANIRVLGGIAGRAAGQINRCRYSGNITGLDGGYTESGYQIGGICANAQNGIVIENCLFDGTIRSRYTGSVMRVGGILAANEENCGVAITIQNCLFNGCLDLVHDYIEPQNPTAEQQKKTQNGIIAGYWDTSKASLINNIYYLKQCPDLMAGMVVGEYGTPPSVNNTTEVEVNDGVQTPNWTEIFNGLNINNSWTIVSGYPVPNLHVCDHVWNEFGWCTKCGARRPIEKDGEVYLIKYISDLATFRDQVNGGNTSSGVVYNARLCNDLDFENFPGDLGEPIGNSHFNRYLYNFDGQGYTIRNIRITADNEYIGMFGFAGDATHDCHIHDFSISGVINVPYDSKLHDNNPLYMGVVGKMYRGTIENVHSTLTMRNSERTRAKIGGILGCAETTGDDHAVVIRKCSYSGLCEANAVGDMGGIVGRASKNTLIESCTFVGTMDHVYQGINNTTQFGGIVGYNEDPDFAGVRKCVVAGILKAYGGRTFVNYDQVGNHKNVLCGYDTQISLTGSRYANNYARNEYAADPVVASSVVKPTFVTPTQMASGKVCAILNELDSDPSDAQAGQPWGQVLGYQVGSYSTPDSPSEFVPYPGYRNHDKTIYKVVRDNQRNYLADWYFFDDSGDETPLPDDANSMRVRRLQYTRAASYMQGYISVCMPFALSASDLPSGSMAYEYSLSVVQGGELQGIRFRPYGVDIPAGYPCFLKLGTENQAWEIDRTDQSGIPLALTPTVNIPGINGSYNTVTIGLHRLKLTSDGENLAITSATSVCYPFRTYVQLDNDELVPTPSMVYAGMASARVPVSFDAEEDTPTDYILPDVEGDTESAYKVVIDDRIVIIREGHCYTATGLLIR